jgi:hypothetical protein
MDRHTQFGLRGDADEQIRRAVRDGFRRAGLSPAQLTQAMEWYRDRGQHLGGDPAKLAESFSEFAESKGWQGEQQDAAVSVYGLIRDQGPAAVMAPAPGAEEDAATIAKADELLRTKPDAYWRDHDLQEAALEARERQQAAPAPTPDPFSPAASEQLERQIAQQTVDKFARMLREEPGKYWSSPDLQRQHHDAIAASIGETPGSEAPPLAPPAPSEPGQPVPLMPAPSATPEPRPATEVPRQ